MKPIIEFILDEVLFASRTWEMIPRVGEIVLFKDGKIWAEVTQVVWGDDSAAPPSCKRQWVQVLCRQIEIDVSPRMNPGDS